LVISNIISIFALHNFGYAKIVLGQSYKNLLDFYRDIFPNEDSPDESLRDPAEGGMISDLNAVFIHPPK